MSRKSLTLTDELHTYLVEHGSPPDWVARELIVETAAVLPDEADMQVAPEQAAFLTLLTRLLEARWAVEIGTFTGLSALAIARGMPPDGRLICMEVARRYWAEAGVAERIDLRLGPAAETLRTLPIEPHLDLAFIDADKTGYATYWAELVPRMRSGGVIAVDNVLWSGRVLAPHSEDDRAIDEFNKMVVGDERVEAVMLPIADGLTLARRR
jgi:caffeoyl-CoA O-methyltransferase